MKTWKVIVAIVVSLAAIAGIVYLVATYGDRISAWARNLLNRANFCRKYEFDDNAVVAESADFAG